MTSTRTHLRALIFVSGSALLAWPVFAQSPRYTPPPPPTKNSTFELRFRYMLSPDVSFKGLGSIPFRDSYETEGNLILGTERSISYDDGYLGQDYIEQTLVGGGGEDQENVLSPNTGATANFGYFDAGQVDPGVPDTLIFHRYASVADPDAELEGSSSGSLGWEVNYTKYLGRKRNLGFQVGFSFNGFDTDYNGPVDADLLEVKFKHTMEGGNPVPDLPDPIENEDGTTTQPPFTGEVVREDLESDVLLNWFASEEAQELIEGGATVDSKADLRSSIYNFRAGPTYNLRLMKSIGLQLGAGVTAIYYAGRFSAFELLQNPGNGEAIGPGLTTTEDADWQFGGYFDASAYYQFTDRVSFFSGAQFQSGSTYTQSNGDREVDVDFDSQFYIHAGLGIRF